MGVEPLRCFGGRSDGKQSSLWGPGVRPVPRLGGGCLSLDGRISEDLDLEAPTMGFQQFPIYMFFPDDQL